MEDIPQGVTAVLTESTTDVLSHVAIRARSQWVLLATCFDDAEWQRLTAMQVRLPFCCRCCTLVDNGLLPFSVPGGCNVGAAIPLSIVFATNMVPGAVAAHIPQGQHVGLEVTPTGEVIATPMDAPTNGASGGAGGRQPHKLKLAPPAGWAGWAVPEAQFAPGEVCLTRLF